MPRKKSSVKTKVKPRSIVDQVNSYWKSLNLETEANQSKLSMVLGALIILVVGILVFNYFNRSKPSLGPSQNTENVVQDVSPDNLPGKYTVKEGDTLFTIAEKYYKDGSRFTEIAQANNLTDPNTIEAGESLNIPKLTTSPEPTASTSEASPEASVEPSPTPAPSAPAQQPASEDTIWGSAIKQDTYTVVEDDWLSKIAERAYGDALAYNKIAQVNNIQNPDLIFPGQILTIPR